MQPPERTSQILLARATRGDDAAVEELLLRHLAGLRAFIRLRAGGTVRKREAESDLVQSVCREVLARAGEFRYGGEAGFRHWLYTTALRKIVNKHEFHTAARRDVGRDVGLEAAQPDAPDGEAGVLLDAYGRFASPSCAAIAAEELDRIDAAFAHLSDDHREVILLSRVVGLSRAEIAQEMERTEASVRNLLHRALAHLAQLLDTSRGDS